MLGLAASARLAMWPVAGPLVDCCRWWPTLTPLLLWACCGLCPHWALMCSQSHASPCEMCSCSRGACGSGRTLRASCVLGGPAVCWETLPGGAGGQASRPRAVWVGFGPCILLFAYSRGREQGPQGRRPEREGCLGHTGQQSRLL